MCYRTGKNAVCRRVRASFSPEIVQAEAVKGVGASSMDHQYHPVLLLLSFLFTKCSPVSCACVSAAYINTAPVVRRPHEDVQQSVCGTEVPNARSLAICDHRQERREGTRRESLIRHGGMTG